MNEVHFESKDKLLDHLRMTMLHAAKNMEFEEAARIRDQIGKLEEEL
jgi:excinuclease ABC subunit B